MMGAPGINGYRVAIILALLLVATLSVHAQPGDPTDPTVPITGLEYLLGAGALYGIKKIYDARKKKAD